MWEFSPSGNCLEYRAYAIGARSQSARTYCEKFIDSFDDAALDDLIQHALLALRDTMPTDDNKLTAAAISLGWVGKDFRFVMIEDEDAIQAYIDRLPAVPARETPAEPVASSETAAVVSPPPTTEEASTAAPLPGNDDGMDVE